MREREREKEREREREREREKTSVVVASFFLNVLICKGITYQKNQSKYFPAKTRPQVERERERESRICLMELFHCWVTCWVDEPRDERRKVNW